MRGLVGLTVVVVVLAVALCAPADAAGAAAKARRRVPMEPPPRADLALVTIKESYAQGEAYSNELVGRWRALLETNHQHPTLTAIDDVTFLVHMTEKVDRDAVREFFLEQPEVESVKIHDRVFHPHNDDL